MNVHDTAPRVNGYIHEAHTDEVCLRDLLQEALSFRAWGWSVFPLNDQKKPTTGWKQLQDRRPTDREIGRMFDRAPRAAGIAVVLGRLSGGGVGVLAVRDFDTQDGYREWARRRPGLAAMLPTVVTRRGFHVYCRLRGREFFQKLEDGDLRADRGHYAVLPPSLHPSGVRYLWRNRPVCLADFSILSTEETGFLPQGATPYAKESSTPSKTRTGNRAPTRGEEKNTMWSPPPPLSGDEGCEALADRVYLSGFNRAEQEAVRRTLPTCEGERNDKLLYLARSLKDIDPAADVSRWLPLVRAWWALAYPAIGTKDPQVTWARFVTAWSEAITPIARSRPLQIMSGVANTSLNVSRRRVLGAFSAMFTSNGWQPVYLSERTAARVACISKTRAHVVLTQLVREGWLKAGQKKPSVHARRATVYTPGPRMFRTDDASASDTVRVGEPTC
jgi:hypothetical protein